VSDSRCPEKSENRLGPACEGGYRSSNRDGEGRGWVRHARFMRLAMGLANPAADTALTSISMAGSPIRPGATPARASSATPGNRRRRSHRCSSHQPAGGAGRGEGWTDLQLSPQPHPPGADGSAQSRPRSRGPPRRHTGLQLLQGRGPLPIRIRKRRLHSAGGVDRFPSHRNGAGLGAAQEVVFHHPADQFRSQLEPMHSR